MEKELWKPIKGYEWLYEVSNLGNVRSLPNKTRKGIRLLKKTPDVSYGYYIVNLYKNGKTVTFRVHRLVAETFLPNPNNYPVVNHINEIKTDNRVCNLEWCTVQYNTCYGTGLKRTSEKQKNDPNRSKKIVQMSLSGEVIKVWPSLNETRRNGFRQHSVYDCCQGKQKTHRGYLWAYL